MRSIEVNPRHRLLDALGWIASASDELERASGDLPETVTEDIERVRYDLEAALSKGLGVAEQLVGGEGR